MNTGSLDTEETRIFLQAFDVAWRKCIEDYCSRRINSEHCLQAALYHHLRGELNQSSRRFDIYAEAVVQPHLDSPLGANKRVIDLVVKSDDFVVGGIELKYSPRGKPAALNIRKDLESLSLLSSRRDKIDRVEVEMPRFNGPPLNLKVLKQRKLIFAAIVADECNVDAAGIWRDSKPAKGYWERRTGHPPNLGIALAHTSTGKCVPKLYGPPFKRLGLESKT